MLSIIFNVLIFVAMVFLFCKYKRLAVLATATQALPKTTAAAILLATPTTLPSTTTENNIPDIPLDLFRILTSIFTTTGGMWMIIKFISLVVNVLSRSPRILHSIRTTLCGPVQYIHNVRIYFKIYTYL